MVLKVVAQMCPETYEEVLELLRTEGLNPVALSDPVSGAHYDPSNDLEDIRAVVYIAVPRDERLAAEQSVKKWRQRTKAANKRIAGTARKDAFGAFMVAGGLGALLFALGREFEVVIMWSVGVWTVIFLAGFIMRNSSEQGDCGNES